MNASENPAHVKWHVIVVACKGTDAAHLWSQLQGNNGTLDRRRRWEGEIPETESHPLKVSSPTVIRRTPSIITNGFSLGVEPDYR